MRIKAVILEGFRSYQIRTRIDLEALTAFVGKNDAGKSSVLEALEIFFNSEQIKFDRGDLCVHTKATGARIGCVFSEYPEELVIDARAKTTLKDELLLNSDGELEIHKIFDCSGKTNKETVVAVAHHPSGKKVENLLLKKNEELKELVRDAKIPTRGIDLRSNVQLRQALRGHFAPLTLKTTEIPLDSEDAKKVWDQLKLHLPLYALFRADRPSQDADDEVQNPLKIAVAQAVKDLAKELQKIQEQVREKAEDVAKRTLKKLKEMDEKLAAELVPDFKAEPKWDKLFNFSLMGDDGIPINKRGSGVRRLILISFFRAEAEQRRAQKDASHIIYAIEEPETSQNPLNQRMLIEALLELSEQPNIQVLLTTHTPGLAGLIPHTSLRHIQQDANKAAVITAGNKEIYLQIAKELGVTADVRLQILLCVEGPTDVDHISHYSSLLHTADSAIVDLNTDPRIALVPIGGSNLKQWVENHYLKDLHIPEVHIYDRGADIPPRFQVECDQMNTRTDGSWAVLTDKLEIENYLHPDAVQEALSVTCGMGANDDVVVEIIKAWRAGQGEAVAWEDLPEEKQRLLESRMKRRLVREVLPRMTITRLREMDADNEIEGWLRRLSNSLQ